VVEHLSSICEALGLIPCTAKLNKIKKLRTTGLQWLTPIISATWEAEIRRIKV
jgi:hypothetical protein